MSALGAVRAELRIAVSELQVEAHCKGATAGHLPLRTTRAASSSVGWVEMQKRSGQKLKVW
jgi:hypothetical protein